MTLPTSADRGDDDLGRCLAPADRTAFAFGEAVRDGTRHAAISRHLLRCPRCRAEVDAAASLHARLVGFGRGGDWEADVGAALAAERGRDRVRRRAALAGVAAAAGIVAVLGLGLGLASGRTRAEAPVVADERPAAAPTASRPAPPAPSDDAARARLLASQAPDGRFLAATRYGGARHDEATTALAILALVRADRGVPTDPAGARAVAAAVRWLRLRQTESGGFATGVKGGALRDQALATAALVEVGAATGDPGVRTAADRAVRALAAANDATPRGDDADARWVRTVLESARARATAGEAAGVAAPRWPAELAAAASPFAQTLALVERARPE